jgi:4'-phosphopantetheinyl transferase
MDHKEFSQFPLSSKSSEENAVHVWKIALDVDQNTLERLQTTLDTSELHRASRFRFHADKRRFIIGHSALRIILSRYAGMAPNKITFLYNTYGKPELPNHLRTPPIHFNISHSGELALIGICHNRRVGIDIERLDRSVRIQAIADRYFSPEESEAIRSLPPEQQRLAFFRCWTAKEAYLKALGVGLYGSLNNLRTSICNGNTVSIRRFVNGNRANESWTLKPLDVGKNYVATLAVEGHNGQLSFHQLDETHSSS